MLWTDILFFIISCIVLMKASSYAVKAVTDIGRYFNLLQFTTSFILVGFVATFPELFIALTSVFANVPQVGIGTLLGSNVADLTLILGIVAIAGRGIEVKSKVIRMSYLYLILIAIPVLLMIDGTLSRLDGLVLITAFLIYMISLVRNSMEFRQTIDHLTKKQFFAALLLFAVSIAFIFLSAHYVVAYAKSISYGLGIPQLIIGLVFIAIGTCLPELAFSVRAVMNNLGEIALGDILGNVIIDATLVLGIMALLKPIAIDTVMMLTVGMFMVVGTIISLVFVESGKKLTVTEGIYLILFYLLFLGVAFYLSLHIA